MDTKPCPFCGGKAVALVDRVKGSVRIACKKCGCSTPEDIWPTNVPPGTTAKHLERTSFITLLRIWNRRV